MDQEKLRQLLCELGTAIRSKVVSARQGLSAEKLAAVTGDAGGDTIFAIDRFGEDAILEWFRTRWPADEPVQIVMEGLESELCFPEGKSAADTKWKCIIDPIDGTRGLMYDKRSAWALAAVAPQRGDETRLSQILAAAMTEIPVSKQWRADQFSASLDGPLVATWCDWRAGSDLHPLQTEPSTAHSFEHGFASLAKFFPEGRTLTAQIEERLWDQLVGSNSSRSPVVFDDQYLSTAGQFHELITGRDRMVGDLRPLVFHALDLESSLVCHPYDACAWLLLKKAGVIFEHPLGGFPDAPLDTESGVAWIAYANETLADKARPVLQKILREFLP
jgi:fructose-1,6-bisphosphatase/inositol monophosphatase family enzyme